MLKRLHIKNFALIDKLEIEFDAQLNVLTGETGAGKSIIIEAMALLLGGRGSTEQIRTGETRAAVEGCFALNRETRRRIQDCVPDIEVAGEEEIVVRREYQSTGRGRALINDQVVSLAALREIAGYLLEIYGQGEQYSLAAGQMQLKLLDDYAGTTVLRRQVGEIFNDFQATGRRFAQLRDARLEHERRREYLLFQLNEIETVAPQTQEDEQLAAERKLLAQAEKALQLGSRVYAGLYESDESLLSRLAAAEREVGELVELGAIDAAQSASLEAAAAHISEVADAVRSFAYGFEFSPERLQHVEARLESLERLKRKYGGSLDAVEQTQAELHAQLADSESVAAEETELGLRLETLRERYAQAAQELSRQRRARCAVLEAEVMAELRLLQMKHARFQVAIETRVPKASPENDLAPVVEAAGTAHGTDEIEFRLAVNEGEELKPLGSVASGGELSRIMLALRTICTRARVATATEDLPGLIFDEVDAGVSGRVAEAVGRRMKRLSERQQVICVTHQAQLARFGTSHYAVRKSVEAGRTRTHLKLLNQEERVAELAMLIGGDTDAAPTRETARWMLRETDAAEVADNAGRDGTLTNQSPRPLTSQSRDSVSDDTQSNPVEDALNPKHDKAVQPETRRGRRKQAA